MICCSCAKVPIWMTFMITLVVSSKTTWSFQLLGRTSCPWSAPRGGSVSTLERNNGTLYAIENNTVVLNGIDSTATATTTRSTTVEESEDKVPSDSSLSNATSLLSKPRKVLFLSADTGGGHRASAQSLMHQVCLTIV